MIDTQNKFLIFDHPQGIALRVVGETLKDLFSQALEGMAYLLYRDYAPRGAAPASVPVKVSSLDVQSLLVDFLSEALYQSDLRQSVFPEIRMKKFTNTEIEAELYGKNIPRFDRSIKVVTYQDVRVVHNPDGAWQADVVFEL